MNMQCNSTKNEASRNRTGWLCRLRANDRGAAALEFAFVAPVFLALLFAVIELGRLYLFQASLQYTVEQVGRYAVAEYTRGKWISDMTSSEARTAVEATASDTDLAAYLGWHAGGITYSATTTNGSGVVLDTVVVTGSYNFTFLVPWIPFPPIQLNASATLPMFG